MPHQATLEMVNIFLNNLIFYIEAPNSISSQHFLTGDNKLSENEAVEEIKQLARQLQNLYDRIPQRGPTTNVILTLIEICRAAQQPHSVSLKPPDVKLAICNGNGNSSSSNGTNGSCKLIESAMVKALCYLDKATNTSFDNLACQQIHSTSCGQRTLISDDCDQNNTTRNNKCNSHKCCLTVNKTTRTKMNDSTGSINFDNLQLQCMCSSENNSIEDYQIDENDDTCDNCCSMHKDDIRCHAYSPTADSTSFRERLLNFTSCNHSKSFGRDDVFRANTKTNNLLKRNSELALGTNFEASHGDEERASATDGCHPYRVSCDNIFSDNSENVTAVIRINKSTCVQAANAGSPASSQIPYSFLERPSIKTSQAEDQSLRELKIALSSTLPVANRYSNSNANTCSSYSHPHPLPPNTSVVKPTHLSLKCTTSNQPPPPPPRTIKTLAGALQLPCTSSANMSSAKIEKAPCSISTSSMSESPTPSKQQPHQQLQQQQSDKKNDDDMRNITDESHKMRDEAEMRSINNQNDNKSEHNKMIIAASKNVEEASVSSASSTSSNVNNKSINKNDEDVVNVGGGSGKKRKTPEGKLAIDLNDRSKYTDEVSV